VKTKEYKVRLSDDLAKHLGATPEEIENQIYEEVILNLLSCGKIDVFEAAEKLNCDPDDLLTPEQECEVEEGFRQIENGEFMTLDELENELDR